MTNDFHRVFVKLIADYSDARSSPTSTVPIEDHPVLGRSESFKSIGLKRPVRTRLVRRHYRFPN